jgi:hypothetical protein
MTPPIWPGRRDASATYERQALAEERDEPPPLPRTRLGARCWKWQIRRVQKRMADIEARLAGN